jgi:hypothetical protein
VVLVCPGADTVVVVAPVAFDRAPTAVVVGTAGPDPAPVLLVVGVAATPGVAAGAVVVVVVATAAAWGGGTSVEALQIWAYEGVTLGGALLELSG